MPSADQVAAALVVAARAFGENPVAIAAGVDPFSVAAPHAAQALKWLCPGATWERLFALCGAADYSGAALAALQAKPAWRWDVASRAYSAAWAA
jgi:hypothetical protein